MPYDDDMSSENFDPRPCRSCGKISPGGKEHSDDCLELMVVAQLLEGPPDEDTIEEENG